MHLMVLPGEVGSSMNLLGEFWSEQFTFVITLTKA